MIYYLGFNKEYNDSISNTQIPHNFGRKPRKFSEVMKWKSSEIKTFGLYLMVPFLINKVNNAFLYYIASYICAVRLFYEPVESIKDLELGNELITNYIKHAEEFYSMSAYSYTLHAHLHLKDQVLEHGPLQDNSQFVFEVKQFLNKY